MRRDSPALFDCLEAAGATLRRLGARGWPLEVRAGAGRPESLLLVRPSSSQEVTGFCYLPWRRVAAAPLRCMDRFRAGPTCPSPCRCSAFLAVRWWWNRCGQKFPGGVTRYRVSGELRAPENGLYVEPDASAAAVGLAAACLSGGTARVEGLGPESVQGDVRIVGAPTCIRLPSRLLGRCGLRFWRANAWGRPRPPRRARPGARSGGGGGRGRAGRDGARHG